MPAPATRQCVQTLRTHWSANPLGRSQCRQLSRPGPLRLSSIALQLYPPQSHTFSTFARSYASILSALSDNKGAYNKRIRRGRGPGSGKGKTSGRGHGGQKSRGKPPPNFEGGQTPIWKLKPTKGLGNPAKERMVELNLDRLQSWVDQGRLNPNRPITMYELYKSGCTSAVRDGIKLLSRGSVHLKTSLHLVVSRASASAIEAIESAGGSVTTRFYSRFAIRKILKGETDPINSRLFVPTPITRLARSEGKPFRFALPDPIRRKDLEYYRDVSKRGYLSYMVPEGQTPSLFFKMPGLGRTREVVESKAKAVKDNRLW